MIKLVKWNMHFLMTQKGQYANFWNNQMNVLMTRN